MHAARTGAFIGRYLFETQAKCSVAGGLPDIARQRRSLISARESAWLEMSRS